MNKQTPARNEQERRAFVIAVVFLVGILANLVLSLSLGIKSGDWQQFARAGIVFVFGLMTIFAIIRIRQGQTDNGMWLIISGILLTLTGTAFLLAGFGLLLAFLELVLVGAAATLGLAKEKRNRAFGITIAAAGVTYGLDFLPLSYRLPAPAFMTTALPVIAALVLTAFAVLIIRMNWDKFTHFMQSSIRNRLTTIVAGAAIIPVVLVSIVLGAATYTQVRNALTKDAFDKLAAVQTIKANQIASYLSERQGDMVALSETMTSVYNEALSKMDAINTLKRNQTIQLFKTWDADVRDVGADPGVVAGVRALDAGFQEIDFATIRSLYLGKGELQTADDGSSYSAAHLEQQGFFAGYTAIHGYKDAFLISPTGRVVYSLHKSDVFGTNLVTGPYKDSNLARLYQNLVTAPAGKTYIADVAIFEAGYAMFIGTPIYDGTQLVGILAYQLPLDVIKDLMADRAGQGATGETFLIAMEDDGRITYRSDRVTAGDGDFVVGYDLTSIATQFMRNALDGQTGGGMTISSTGETVINAYRPLEIEGLNWAIQTRITAAEALSPKHSADKKDFLTNYKENYGYYDLFLIEPKGFIFYSVAKEAEYGTNILTGEYKDTNLGDLTAEVIESKSFEFADFALYAPTGGKPAAFFAIPVLDAEDNVVMVLGAQVSQEQLGAIMAETTGLGETGETFIIGHDKLRRSETRFLADLGAESTILNPEFKVDTVASRSVLAGESSQATFNDYRGLPVMAVWSPVALAESDTSTPESQTWGVIAKVDVSEALAPVNQLAGTLGLVIGLAVLGIGTLAVFVGARFSIGFVTPILGLANTATQVAAGNMNLTVETNSKDEIGTLSNAFNSMTSQLRELIGSLEGRVAARTKDMETVAEVSTATATILEIDKLLQAVVDLSKERFELYHAHIYLLDEAGKNLVLAAGAGEPGRIMAAEKRSIPLNREQSLVAHAAREGKGIIVNDVTKEPDFLPNPLLPDTRSEMAVPMIVGGKVIGVFDVQSEHTDRFTESDIQVKTTLAAQVSISLQNVRAFEQSKSQADLETLVNAIGHKIQLATTVEDTLQTAIREVGLALGASRVSANLQVTREDNGYDNKN